jgi:PST family polysaccharide transporter
LIKAYGLGGYGEYVFLFSIVNYCEVFVNFSFDYYLLRVAVENKENKPLINRYFNVSVISRLFIFISILIILIIVINLFSIHNGLILVVLYLTLLKTVFVPVWYFQSINNLNIISVASFISNIILLIAAIIIFRLNLPIIYFVGAVLLSSLIQIFVIYGKVQRYLSFYLYNLDDNFKGIRYLFRVSFINFFSKVTQLYTNFTKIILGVIFTNEIVAIFEISNRIINFSAMPFAMLNNSIYPEVLRTKNIKKIYRNLRLEIILISFIVMILFFMKPFIFLFFSGSSSLENSYILTILSFTIFAIITNQVLGFHILYSFGYDKIRAKGIFLSSIFYVIALFIHFIFNINNIAFICIALVLAEFTSTLYYLINVLLLKTEIQKKSAAFTEINQKKELT